MKKLLLMFFFSFSLVNAQEKMKINESTKKYEMNYELDFSGKKSNNLFSDVNEWLATNYNVEGSSLKFSDEKKGKIIFNGAMIFKQPIVSGDSVITFTMTFIFNDNIIKCNVTNFIIEHRNGNNYMRGRAYEYEKKGAFGWNKIFNFTEERIDTDINNLTKVLNK